MNLSSQPSIVGPEVVVVFPVLPSETWSNRRGVDLNGPLLMITKKAMTASAVFALFSM